MIRDVLAPNPGPYTLYGTRTWLLGERVMIDPGPAIESHIDAIIREQPGVEHVLITHRHGDHAPAAREVARRTGARVLAPVGVLDDDVVDIRIGDGFAMDTEVGRLRAVATPGHTAEHLCFITDQGDLFSGDTVLGEGTTAIFLPDGDMGAYLSSLKMLRDLAPKRIYPAHGAVREDAVVWIDHYIEHRTMRERQISSALSVGPVTLGELRAAIYPDIHEALVVAAEGQLLAHLIHMAGEGRAGWDGKIASK